MRSFYASALAAFCVFVNNIHAVADDHFYIIPLDHTEFRHVTDGNRFAKYHLHAKFDSGLSGIVAPRLEGSTNLQLVFRSEQPLERVSGKLYLPNGSKMKHKEFDFDFELDGRSVDEKNFYSAKEEFYRNLANARLPGQRWFQHKLEEALVKQGKPLKRNQSRNRLRSSGFDRSLDFFSGSRAIMENIQLDRELLRAESSSPKTIDVDSIPGITIQEFDWKPHLKEVPPKLDALAQYIPHDQHVIFLKSVESLAAIMAESGQVLTPAFGGVNSDSIDAQVIPRYLRQMMLDLRKLSREESAKQIKSIAITGGDPYSELGTDIGVVVEFKNEKSAEAFSDFLFGQFPNQSQIKAIDGIENSNFVQSPDRSVSLHSHRNGNILWLSNSNYQIRYLKKCASRTVVAISTLDGYRFFRQRYPIEEGESAFVFMSDAAIRRWCSPKWRIGQSRRVRASAELSMQHAEHLTEAVSMKPGQTRALSTQNQQLRNLLGKRTLSNNGIHSDKFGTVGFVTPISEMAVEKVTESEKNSYERWRNNYQRNWSNAFDPIAIQVKMTPKTISTDISVVPLILSSQFRTFREGKPFSIAAGDRHVDSLLHVIFALGPDDFLWNYYKGLKTVELFIDDHPTFWRDFDEDQDAEKYFIKNFNHFPFAIEVDFDKPESMKNFLALVRGLTQQQLVEESKQTFKEIEYERRRFEFGPNEIEEFDLFICEYESKLFVSLSEQTMKNIISRIKSREDGTFKKDEPRHWLGQNLAIQTNAKFYKAIEVLWRQYYQSELRDQTWRNFPILQEWKREFPDQDPFEFHQKYWHQKMLCAGGGDLLWDKKTNSPKSTVFGNPRTPRIPMSTPTPWRDFKSFDAGVTFDTGGIRGKMMLERK